MLQPPTVTRTFSSMYDVAVIGAETTLFADLESCAHKYFDNLVALFGPFRDITSATAKKRFIQGLQFSPKGR